MDIKIYKICKFLYDIKNENYDVIQTRNKLSSLILSKIELSTHITDLEYGLTFGFIENDIFYSCMLFNKPEPHIILSASGIDFNYNSKLDIFYVDGKYTIQSNQFDNYHGYRKEIIKEFNCKSSIEDLQLIDILENNRNQIFISDRILNLLK